MHYRFGHCELSTDSRELRVEGAPVRVEPKVFDLLCCFVEHPGRLLSHDELIERVWGGRIVSDSAIGARISAARAAIGDDGARQELTLTLPRRGFRFLPTVETGNPTETASVGRKSSGKRHNARFCQSPDGTRIAYATIGSGYPLARAGHWLTHLEYDWRSPLWRPFLQGLSESFSLTRYDQRGNGLSDWDVADLSLARCVDDLEAVADDAHLDRFALYGTSQGVPIAIAYTIRHPERVSHLILHGGYRRGRLVRTSAQERAEGEAILTLIRHGWGRTDGAFVQAFSSMFIPGAETDQLRSLAELQRRSTSPENAARLRKAVDHFDVSDILHQISAPTLVLHARDDGIHPLDQGRKLAADIPGAEFVLLESGNHVLLETEAAWNDFFNEIEAFTKRKDIR